MNEYLDSIIAAVDMEAIREAGLRVALDPMYGVSETSIKTVLMTARCEVETIHERHDTLFGGKLPAPTADTLRALQNYVLDRNATWESQPTVMRTASVSSMKRKLPASQ